MFSEWSVPVQARTQDITQDGISIKKNYDSILELIQLHYLGFLFLYFKYHQCVANYLYLPLAIEALLN